MNDVPMLIISSVGLGVVSTLLWQEIKPGALIYWFLWERWFFKKYTGKDISLLACHNNNLYGCRKHPVIYNDMCRIVRGVK